MDKDKTQYDHLLENINIEMNEIAIKRFRYFLKHTNDATKREIERNKTKRVYKSKIVFRINNICIRV